MSAQRRQGPIYLAHGAHGPVGEGREYAQIARLQSSRRGGCVGLKAAVFAQFDQCQGHDAQHGHGGEQPRGGLELESFGAQPRLEGFMKRSYRESDGWKEALFIGSQIGLKEQQQGVLEVCFSGLAQVVEPLEMSDIERKFFEADAPIGP